MEAEGQFIIYRYAEVLKLSDPRNFTPRNETGIKDRRRKPDWVTNMANILSGISWLFAFGVWVMLDMALPEKENIFTRMFDVKVRNYWDESFLTVAFVLLVTSLCICVSAFIFNVLRKRRKTDKYKKSIIVSGIISSVGIIIFIVRFGSILF